MQSKFERHLTINVWASVFSLASAVLARVRRLVMPKKRARTFVYGATITLALPLFEAGSAQAEVPEAGVHYDKGIVQYNLGHFPEAIGEFEKAYELDASPILLFNLAQAYRQEGNTERAIFFYRRYLTLAPSAKNRGDVEKRLKELEELRQRQDDLKGKPPTGIEAPGSGAAVAGEPAGPRAEAAHPPSAAKGMGPAVLPGQVAPTPSHEVPEAKSPAETAIVFASGGVAVAHFSGPDLASPAIFNGELGGRLVLLPGNDRVEAGLAGVLSFLPYSRTDGLKGRSSFPGAFADIRISHGLGSRTRLGLGVGAGVVWWAGLGEKNPFTAGGTPASGAVAMPSVRLGPTLTFELTQGLYAGITPRFVFSKTTSGLSSTISSVLRFEFPIEVGYVF